MKLVRFLMKLTGETVTVILKNGSEVYGAVTGVDMSMNIHLKSAKLKVKNTGDDPIKLDFMTIRGSNIRCIHLPETLQLDSLLIDDVPKVKAKRARIDGTGTGTRGRGRGRARGRARGSYRGRQ